MMFFSTSATMALLASSVFVAAEPMPYRLGSMSLNRGLGDIMRRQNGYQPSQSQCGPGADCAASCGSTYIQCGSKDGNLHCYDPAVKETCCTDGTGNSCQAGYYCTNDSSGQTWCCPNGMDLASCAAAYGLTGSLVSQVATSTPASTPPSSSPVATTNVSTTPSGGPTATSTITSINTYTPTSCSSGCLSTFAPSSNATLVSTAPPVQFSGAATAQVVGLPALVMAAAGAIFAL